MQGYSDRDRERSGSVRDRGVSGRGYNEHLNSHGVEIALCTWGDIEDRQPEGISDWISCSVLNPQDPKLELQ